LHPGADQRNELANPEDHEIAGGQGWITEEDGLF